MRTKPPCTNYKFVRVKKDKTHQSLECEYKARVGSLVYFKTSVDRHYKNR